MGSRTRDLPELGGVAGIIREIRYHEFSRQAIGIILIAVYSYWSAPTQALFWLGARLSRCWGYWCACMPPASS